MSDFVDNVVTTIKFFWPFYAAFIFAIVAVGARFIHTSFSGHARHAAQHPGIVAASRNDECRDLRQVESPPSRPSVFDQALLPAWMPTAPECHLEYRAFNRRKRNARRSLA